jgi:hypothetical protein
MIRSPQPAKRRKGLLIESLAGAPNATRRVGGVVAHEEAYLTRKFGDAYLDHAQLVRRRVEQTTIRSRFLWLARPDCDSF